MFKLAKKKFKKWHQHPNISEVDGLLYLLEAVIEKKEEELAELKDMLVTVDCYK